MWVFLLQQSLDILLPFFENVIHFTYFAILHFLFRFHPMHSICNLSNCFWHILKLILVTFIIIFDILPSGALSFLLCMTLVLLRLLLLFFFLIWDFWNIFFLILHNIFSFGCFFWCFFRCFLSCFFWSFFWSFFRFFFSCFFWCFFRFFLFCFIFWS